MGNAFDVPFYLIALFVQFRPENVFQHIDAQSADGGDEHMRDAGGQRRFYFVHQFLVQHVTLGDGQYALLVQHLGIECLQFVQQNVVLPGDVIRIGRYHEEQQ